jgi:CHASE2 domain-containing sensor protein
MKRKNKNLLKSIGLASTLFAVCLGFVLLFMASPFIGGIVLLSLIFCILVFSFYKMMD